MYKTIFFFLLISALACNRTVQVTNEKPEQARIFENHKEAKKALNGKWMLQAIKFYPQTEIIEPKKEYWIEFDDKKFYFNKEVNDCHSFFRLSEAGLEISSQIACTKKCCDKDISDELDYQNVKTFKLYTDKLVLETDKKKFEFVKSSLK